MNNSSSTSVLASFATLKSLNDSKKYINSYQILAEFIKYIIDAQNLYVFSAVEMKNRLKSVFGFDIPEAVVKTASKSLPFITKEKGTYVVDTGSFTSDHTFEQAKAIAEQTNAGTISLLKNYIISKLSEECIDDETLTQDLIAFLVDDQQKTSGQYTDLISEFVLTNANNKDVQAALKTIREGSILYIGLNYNINETGSLTKKLTLFLDTEVLFSLVGFNGEVYRQLAEDFYSQIKSANANGTKIVLRYFSEVKREIKSFFNSAKMIIERKMIPFNTVAMRAILNSCVTTSDIDIKESDFFYSLQYHYGILEDEHDNYYAEESEQYNLESMEYTANEQACESWKFISHINKLRKGALFTNNFDAEFLIVTNTKSTLNISHEQTEIDKKQNELEYSSDYAVSVDKMTNSLWYKLGNGFGTKNYPCNVNMILKARTVLASTISHNILEVYNEAKEQKQNGVITSDQFAARIITLRKKPILPEEIDADSIDEIMDFSPDFLSRYEEEINSNKAALQEKENELRKRDETITRQDQLIQEQNIKTENLESKLAEFHKAEERRERRKENVKRFFRFSLCLAWKFAIIAVITLLASYCLGERNSSVRIYVCRAIELLGLLLTILSAVKKDFRKYFPKKTSAS